MLVKVELRKRQVILLIIFAEIFKEGYNVILYIVLLVSHLT